MLVVSGAVKQRSCRFGEGNGLVGDRGFGEPLLTVGEVATMMRVSNMTVYRLIKAGQLPAVRVGKNYRIRRSDVNDYLDARAVFREGNT